MAETDGNQAQVRTILNQMLDAVEANRPDRQQEIHPLVKWFVGAIAGLGAAAIIGLGFWLVSSVSIMRETLARMDERQELNAQNLSDRFKTIDERLSRLEAQKEQRR